MNCNNAKQYMIFLAEGSLSHDLAASLNRHLAECSQCSYVYQEIRLTLSSVEEIRQIKVDPWFSGRVEQALLNLSAERIKELNKWQMAVKFIRIIPVAASLAIALWVGILIGSELSLKFSGKSDVENLTSNLYEDLVAEDLYDKSLESFFLTNGNK